MMNSTRFRRLAHSLHQLMSRTSPASLQSITFLTHNCCTYPPGGLRISQIPGSSYCYSTSSTSGLVENTNNQVNNMVETKNKECMELLFNYDLVLIPDFITESEEESIMKEIQPYMARLRYEYSHWDDAIHGYRETERTTWNPNNQLIIDRLKRHSFPAEKVSSATNYVHVLDLEADGEIKPHKDSVRYCGDTISGISLLTDSVMRLAKIDNKDIYIDLLLKRRSLYVMRNAARYDYTHEILHNKHATFKGKQIVKGRRISVICRNMPTSEVKE